MPAALLSELQHPCKEGMIILFYPLGSLKRGKVSWPQYDTARKNANLSYVTPDRMFLICTVAFLVNCEASLRKEPEMTGFHHVLTGGLQW